MWSGDSPKEIPSSVHLLKRLHTKDIEQILEQLCGKAIGLSILAEKLHRETEGLPLFLVEFIQFFRDFHFLF